MEKDIFEQVGKRMPYSTPDGFFGQSKERLLATVGAQAARRQDDDNAREPRALTEAAVGRHNIVHRILANSKWLYGMAAAVVLAAGIYGVMRLTAPIVQQPVIPVYCQAGNAAEDWSDFAEADLFLENMNW